MPPKTRFGSSMSSPRDRTDATSSKRGRKELTSPPSQPARRAFGSTVPSETPTQSFTLPVRDAKQAKLYGHLAGRGIGCTRFMDQHALEQVGLSTEVNNLMTSVGWSRLAQLNFPTYKELTLEFLSSFTCDIYPFSNTHDGSINFRLFGEERKHTLETFNAIFGFPLDGVRCMENTTFVAENVWVELTGDDTLGAYTRYSKSSQLKSHALRYIHRFLAHSIFGRGESTGVVRRDELFFLWAMTHRVQLNTAVWMCLHFRHVIQSSGRICVGGLVSIIADFYGFVPIPDLHTRVEGHDRIDLETLISMGMCRKISGEYFLLDADGKAIPKSQAGMSAPPPRHSTPATASTHFGTTATASASTPASTSSNEPLNVTLAAFSRLERMNARMLEEMHMRFDQLNTRVDEFSRMERLQAQVLDQMQVHFDQLNSRVDGLERKLDGWDSD